MRIITHTTKRIATTVLTAIMGVLASLADVTVGIPVQLLESEHDLLPDKTIEASFKPLKYRKGAKPEVITQLDSTLNLICENAYDCRTFLLTFVSNNQITIIDIDPTAINQDECKVLGAVINQGRHFLVRCDKDNEKMLKTIFENDRGKVKYEREFEFVEEKTESRHTSVEVLFKNGNVEILQAIVEGIDINEQDKTNE